jgi:hypothetical protein
VINATHLPPLDPHGQPEGIEEEGMMEEMDMQMDQMGDPYGQEMDDMEGMMEEEEYDQDQGVSFDRLRNTIEK